MIFFLAIKPLVIYQFRTSSKDVPDVSKRFQCVTFPGLDVLHPDRVRGFGFILQECVHDPADGIGKLLVVHPEVSNLTFHFETRSRFPRRSFLVWSFVDKWIC